MRAVNHRKELLQLAYEGALQDKTRYAAKFSCSLFFSSPQQLSGAIVKALACLAVDPKSCDYLLAASKIFLRATLVNDSQWQTKLYNYLSVNTATLVYKAGEYLQQALEIDITCCDSLLLSSLEYHNYAPTLTVLAVASLKSPLLAQKLSELPVFDLGIDTDHLRSEKELYDPAVLSMSIAFPKLKVISVHHSITNNF